VSTITPFVNGVHFWNKDDGIFLGDPRNGMWGIGLSSDGGNSWSALPNPVAASNSAEIGWNNAFAVVGDSIWFGTNQSRIWRSTDRGLTWSARSTPSLNSFGIAFSDGLHGMATFRPDQNNGGTNAIAVTDNGGDTWQLAPMPFASAAPQGVASPQGTGIFYVGTQQGVYQTDDLGQTWEQMAMPEMVFEGGLFAAAYDPSTGLIGAYGNNAYMQLITYKEQGEPDTSNSVLYPSTDVLDASAFSAQVTTIGADRYRLSVDMGSRADFSAGLWGLDGSRVAPIADGTLETGTHDFSFSTSGLASGLYLVVLRSGGRVQTQKLLLVR
jgi:hypothetical protein